MKAIAELEKMKERQKKISEELKKKENDICLNIGKMIYNHSIIKKKGLEETLNLITSTLDKEV